MNLQELRYLVAIADERHFGKAAASVFVSQPTLSTQLRKLERELGVQLIERNSRNVMLTPAGERVAEHARVVLRETETIREIARRTQDPESGSVRIGLFPTLGPYLLPHVVPAMRRRFPQLELLLVEEKTELVLEHLRAGSLDVGVLAMPVPDDGLASEPLFEEDFVLAVPRGHRLAEQAAANGGVVPVSVIATEAVLLLEEGHCLRDQALAVCHIVGASERNGFRATSLETLRQMVAAGVGVTLLPELAVAPPVPVSPDIELIRFAEPVPRRQIAMYWRRSSAFADFLPALAPLLRSLPAGLVRPLGVDEPSA